MYIVENLLVLYFTYKKRLVQQYNCNLCKALIQNFSFAFCFWRLHTLAYVASSGKLYSFGAGENGQLGNNRLSSVNSPVLVHSSWHGDTTDGSKSTQQSVIHRIAAGGDFCYLLAPRNVSNLLLLICKDRIIEDKAEPKKYFLLWITQKTVKTRNISLQKTKGLKGWWFV